MGMHLVRVHQDIRFSRQLLSAIQGRTCGIGDYGLSMNLVDRRSAAAFSRLLPVPAVLIDTGTWAEKTAPPLSDKGMPPS
jgi:hypothetical protein